MLKVWSLAIGLVLIIISSGINMYNFDWGLWWSTWGHSHVTQFSWWFYVFMIPGIFFWTYGVLVKD